jgi:hypothetical protein
MYRSAVEALSELNASPMPGIPASSIQRGLYQPVNMALPQIPVVKVMLHLPKIDGVTDYLKSVSADGGEPDLWGNE